jgi:hypothetical protein
MATTLALLVHALRSDQCFGHDIIISFPAKQRIAGALC